MAKIIISIGIPGSGKTTTLKAFAAKNDYAYISSDDIRRELTGEILDMSRTKEVFDLVRTRIAENLEQGNTVVLDISSAKLEDRQKMTDFAREHGAEKVQGVYFDIPLEVAKERNAEREVVIKDETLERMHKSLEDFAPDVTDGFDSIFTLDENAEVKEVDMKREGGEMYWERKFR